MPIYEYRCGRCGHELEAIQKLDEAPLTTCPACATEGLKKKISAAVFRLRGSGWYETDFKSEKKKNVAGDDAGTRDGGAQAGEAKENGDGKEGNRQPGAAASSAEKSANAGQSGKKPKDKPKSGSGPSGSGTGPVE